MSVYELLKHLHVLLALISGLGFALRGFIRLVLGRPLAHPMMRIGPHVIDTLLLASGIALWVIMAYSPFAMGWFGLKLIGVVVYILLGIASFRMANRQAALMVYLLALVTFLGIAWLALFKPL